MKLPFIYKYQPTNLNNFKLNQELIEILKTFIKMDSLNLLIIGNSGSGKSTLIQTIINEYYHSNSPEQISENILIINNLKEQGISYYRNDVKTFCQTSSVISNKKKIVILDDIDSIHEHSQQAFRNYLDKYNENVHFIASCSNAQKVIESLQSRLNIVKIKPHNSLFLRETLDHICIKENINIDSETKDFIILISNNSIRILINYIEKIKLYNKPVTKNNVSKLCTNISFHEFEKYTILCKEKYDLTNSIAILYKLFDSGFSVIDIFDNYFLFIKTTDILSEVEKYKFIQLLCKYITIFYQIHEDKIELALFTNNIIELLKSTTQKNLTNHAVNT